MDAGHGKMRNNLSKVATSCYNCRQVTCVRHLVKFCNACCQDILKDVEPLGPFQAEPHLQADQEDGLPPEPPGNVLHQPPEDILHQPQLQVGLLCDVLFAYQVGIIL